MFLFRRNVVSLCWYNDLLDFKNNFRVIHIGEINIYIYKF